MDDEKMVDSIKMRQDRRQMTQKIWLHWRWRILYPLRAIAIVIGYVESWTQRFEDASSSTDSYSGSS